MNVTEPSGDLIRAHITGDVSGQVAVGKDITQAQTVGARQPELTDAERAELRQMLTDLRARIEAEAQPEHKEAALERWAELGEAIGAEPPDLTTLAYVQRWFAKHLPALAGAVTSVAKLVAAE